MGLGRLGTVSADFGWGGGGGQKSYKKIFKKVRRPFEIAWYIYIYIYIYGGSQK